MPGTLRSSLAAANQLAMWIAAFCILAMTVIGGLDVLSTAIFRQPLHTTLEVTETLMVFIVYLGLGIVHQNRSHIAVDLFYLRMRPRLQRGVDMLVLVLMFAFFAILAWRGFLAAQRAWNVGEYAPALIPFPLFPARFALATGLTLAAVNCLFELFFGLPRKK